MSCFSKVFGGSSEYRSIRYNIARGSFPFGVLGLAPTPKALLIHTLCEEQKHGAVVLAPDDGTAEKLLSDLTALGSSAVTYPARDLNFYSVETSSKEYEQKRMGALAKMLTGEADILILSAEAAMQKIMPKKELQERIFTLSEGLEISTDEIRRKLIKCGYTAADTVEGHGQFSLRGGILDIFPCNLENPIRIEFWGDEIDSISYFDILSQRREDRTDSVSLAPATEIIIDNAEETAEKLIEIAKAVRTKNSQKVKEFLYKDAELLRAGIIPGCCDKYLPVAFSSLETPLDYFPDKPLLVIETSAVKEHLTSSEKMAITEIRELFLDGQLCKGLDDYYETAGGIMSYYTRLKTVYIDNFARGSFDTPVKDLINYHINPQSAWDGSYSFLTEDIEIPLKNKQTIVIFAGTEKAAETLNRDLTEDGYSSEFFSSVPEGFLKGKINILPGSLYSGVEYPGEKLLIITYGRHAKSNRRSVKQRTKAANAFNSLEELHSGDYVVHEQHGIGVFQGIEKVKVNGATQDYIRIRYAGGGELFIPVTKLDMITKYIGPHEDGAGKPVKLNRLGGHEWERTKNKVRGAVKDIAQELIKLYAQRQNSPGFAFSPDIDMQGDFEQRFEFDETDDQLRCIYEIKQDMEKHCPMDRLLCGDVGFGKTEVALRAAFKCICDGKQVAFLVPTTILALQHYRTILHRFEGFPIEAEMLCRFRTAKQQKEIIRRIKEGSIDIVSGTHRIISKDVEFKDLGLLIVDEEQRFGVLQKEKLKEKFPNVDVLTLSATPIPRTLNLALSGIRDLSVLEEAPMDRHPVQTYVIEHDMGILSQAIAKELRRGGQVYYLHNNTSDIEEKAMELREFFPDASIDVAHGQMNEAELSDVWKRLTEGEIDILVCTTIIETGVDIPNANTLIIEDADNMGLSQLHQLRGRVGRSTRRASAYCTFRPNKMITEIAERRLSAIREFTQFGSGFKIAMRDLEIRGAGNLLGAKQHGHLADVGYDMYMHLLSEAVEMLKDSATEPPVQPSCQVDIQCDAYIPEDYVSSYQQRIALYKRIASIESYDDYSDVTDELIDRWGEPPECVLGLMKIPLIRATGVKNGITKIIQQNLFLHLYTEKLDPAIIKKLSVLKGRVMTENGDKPCYHIKIAGTAIKTLDEILKLLNEE
ncbi:MAG: transcription-repair coupling factor [Clostridia bacterium]|nr:transcription-repair coupling factor [Clostridia bacterium]